MEVNEFRKIILENKIDDILNNVLLSEDAKHVCRDKQNYIALRIAETYNVKIEDIKLIVVGSAKLGFSIIEKIKNKNVCQRYRAFGPDSDIDIAIISNVIFEIIWHELSKFALSQAVLPWNSDKLGDYLVCGWLRPDFFPKESRLTRCDDWYDTFRKFSSDRTLGRRQIRGGLFFSLEQLKAYQRIALLECILTEKSKI